MTEEPSTPDTDTDTAADSDSDCQPAPEVDAEAEGGADVDGVRGEASDTKSDPQRERDEETDEEGVAVEMAAESDVERVGGTPVEAPPDELLTGDSVPEDFQDAAVAFEPEDETWLEQVVELVADAGDLFTESEESTSTIDQWAYRTFSEFWRTHSEWVTSIQTAARQARMEESYDFYLARATMLTLLAGGFGGLLGVFFALLMHVTGYTPLYHTVTLPGSLAGVGAALRLPVAWGLAAGTIGLFLATPVALFLYYLPQIRAGDRGREIDAVLPQAVTYIYALSQASLTIPAVVRHLAANEDAYGEVAAEFQVVINQMDYLGGDLREALHRTRGITPSDDLAELLSDLSSIVESGGDATAYFETKTEEYQRRALRRKDHHLNHVDTVGRIYTVIGIVGPATLITGILLSAIANQRDLFLAVLSIYVGVPLLCIGFIIYLDTVGQDDQYTAPSLTPSVSGVSPSDIADRLEQTADSVATDGGSFTPVHSRRDSHDGPLSGVEEAGLRGLYSALRRRDLLEALRDPVDAMKRDALNTLWVTVPLAVLWIVSVAALGIAAPTPTAFVDRPVYTTIVTALLPAIGVLTPLSIVHEWQARRQRSVNKKLPGVLDSLASASDQGSDLRSNIQTVAESGNHRLSRELQKTYYELAGWNVSMEDALARLSNRVRNPRLTRVLNLLLDANTTSGRVTEVLEIAAEDARVAWETEQDRLSKIRPQIGIIIGGNILILVISIFVVAIMVSSLDTAFEAAQSASTTGASAGQVLPVGGEGDIDPSKYRLLFYHMALIQSLFSGLVAGKLGYNNVLSGLKFGLPQLVLITGVFMLI